MNADMIEGVRAAVEKIKGRTYPGSSTDDGRMYAQIPWGGLGRLPFHRPATRERVDQITRFLPVSGLRVLDVGCGNGAIAIGMALAGAEHVLAVDRDEQALAVGRVAAQHLNVDDRVEWRRSSDTSQPFDVLAVNISNDEDGDGTAEPMFVANSTTDPSRILVRLTAQSPVPDPKTGQRIRFTVASEVVLRNGL